MVVGYGPRSRQIQGIRVVCTMQDHDRRRNKNFRYFAGPRRQNDGTRSNTKASKHGPNKQQQQRQPGEQSFQAARAPGIQGQDQAGKDLMDKFPAGRWTKTN